MKPNKKLAEIETFYAAMADKTRLRIFNLMRGGEVCVQQLVEILGESQPKVSRHLAFLRSAGIVETRREGKWIYYKIVVPENIFAAQTVQSIFEWLDSVEDLRLEFEKLNEINASIENAVRANPQESSNTFVSPHIGRSSRKELETFLL